MARDAADCRAVLAAIAGEDPADLTSSAEPVRLKRSRPDTGRLRGALITADFEKTAGAEREVGAAFARAVEELRAMGLRLDEASLPDMPASEITTTILFAEAISAFEPFFRDGSVRQLTDVYAPYQREVTEALTGADYVKASRMRALLQERVAEFFETYDFIVTPNFLSVAPPIREDFMKTLPYPDPVGALGTACGLPAIALPAGLGKERRPAGFQIVGPPFSEELLLNLGEAYQARTKHHLARPPLAA